MKVFLIWISLFGPKGSKKLYIWIKSEDIVERIMLGEKDLAALGIPVKEYKRKTGKTAQAAAYVVEGHPFAEDRDVRGVFKGRDYVMVYRGSSVDGLSGLPESVVLGWVGLHEAGHKIEELRFP